MRKFLISAVAFLVASTMASEAMAYRYYVVQITGTDATDIHCGQIFNGTGFYIVRSCDPYVRPQCYQQIRTADNTGVQFVRDTFDASANHLNYDVVNTVTFGACPG